MTDRLNAPVVEAAGGIVERATPDGLRIAVIYRERYGGEWGLPKGKRDRGETWQQTALREVEEEIGLKGTITGVAGATAYLAGNVPKVVLYWRMRVETLPPPFESNEEVKVVEWLTPPEALHRLTHREERTLLASALEGTGAM
jgi:8-oxo-dGTP pyrophosphatase MutT (NUDIX family)